MSTSLVGKVAIVTGSSRSIGAAIAQRLAEVCTSFFGVYAKTNELYQDGANVVVNYVNNSDAAEEVVNTINSKGQGRAISVKADISSITDVNSLLEATIRVFGQLDILVLNAGIMGSRALADVDEQFYDAHMAINVKGPIFLTKAAAPILPPGTPTYPDLCLPCCMLTLCHLTQAVVSSSSHLP